MMRRELRLRFLAIMLAVQVLGCAAPKSREATEVAKGVTQAELQQDIQRFTAVFIDRVAQAMDTLMRSKAPLVREAGVRRALVYSTYSLDIVSEPTPGLGLLDMIVFVTLCRHALEKYWIPEVLKDEGRQMADVFERSEREIWTIGGKVLTREQQSKLKNMIVQWEAENPGQYRVEGVRFGEFSKYAGKLARERAEDSGGMLASVASGVEAADQALLTADRVMFLAQRMPFLVRLQAIVGVGDLMTAINTRVEADQSMRGSARGMMDSAVSLAGLAGQAAGEGRQLVEAMYPLFLPIRDEIASDLASANKLASQTVTILDRLNVGTPAAAGELRRMMMWFALLLTVTGVLLAAAWWTGYYLVKRRLFALSLKAEDRRRSGEDRGKAA